MKIDIKKWIRRIAAAGILPATQIQLFFLNQQCELDYDQSAENLKALKECRPIEIACEHQLTQEYDLMIVIPAYNVKEYISDCLGSVLCQKTSYTYQVVIIDDGSTDGTSERIDHYSADHRVKIIHQRNGGIARARNAGLQIITGRYVMFVDSDDILYPGAIQKLLEKADRFDADIVEGSYYTFDDSGRITNRSVNEETDHDTDFLIHHGGPWMKVMRAELFRQLRYPDGYEYEDSIIGYCVFPASEKKYMISDMVYGCRLHPDSITHTSRKSENCIDTYYLSVYLWEWYAKRFRKTQSFRMLVLRQMVLNYSRTEKLGEDILKSGFGFQRAYYMKMFPKPYDISGKYNLLDRAVRENKWGRYRLICKRWKYL